jgi:hypothetical protein
MSKPRGCTMILRQRGAVGKTVSEPCALDD